MSTLVTEARARLNVKLKRMNAEELAALNAAVSAFILNNYSIPGSSFPADTPGDVQEACVQLMAFFKSDQSVLQERLGDWGVMYKSGTSGFPSTIGLLLRAYPKIKQGPTVVAGVPHTDFEESDSENYV